MNPVEMKVWVILPRYEEPKMTTSLIAQLVKNLPAMVGAGFDPWVGKIPWRRERVPTPVFWPGEFQGLYSRKESDMTE